MVVAQRKHIEKRKERNNMNKCFVKKVLAVILGVSLVFFLAAGVSAVGNFIIADDKIATSSLEQIGKLVNINFAVFGLLLIFVIAIMCANLIKNKPLKIGVESIVFAAAIAVMVVGIIRIWGFRDEMIPTNSVTFATVLYQKWLTYFSNIIELVVFSFSTMLCVFINSFIGCKKEEK